MCYEECINCVRTFKSNNDWAMNDISAIYEEEEVISIKRVYETKALKKVAVMIKAKTINDENLDLEISDSENESAPNKKSNSNGLEDDTTYIKEHSRPNKKAKGALNNTKGKDATARYPRANSNLGPSANFKEKENHSSLTAGIIKRQQKLKIETQSKEGEYNSEHKQQFSCANKRRGTKESFSQFLERQTKHVKRLKDFSEAKSKEKSAIELQELRSKPSINASSRLLAMNLGTAHERLLGAKGEAEQTARDRAQAKAGLKEQPLTFVPVITERAKKIRREEKIEEKLYNDAVEKKKKENMPIKNVDASSKINAISAQCLQKRFEREYSEAVEKFEGESLSFGSFTKFLKTFNCIVTPLDENLARQLWDYLEGDTRNGITKHNLSQTLKAILRIPMNAQANNNFSSSDSDIILTESQCAGLRKTFLAFYVNRCNYEESCTHAGEDYLFSPVISEKSQRLAAVARTKVEGDTLESKLLGLYKRSEEWREKQLKLKEEEIKSSCTFRPQITVLKRGMHKSTLLDMESAAERFDVAERLYELSKTRRTPKGAVETSSISKAKTGARKRNIKSDELHLKEGISSEKVD
eukprot:TRINITY_DN4392_c0_g2_i1.p1 TRINITY_DN4392_c0_g2~~TRINITY_DN4392_c0_g2_i1.p1  ORF type:complete len:585 (-),score=144.82 TRINITY_DN4392_c0_g2_i1:112-1866(-)